MPPPDGGGGPRGAIAALNDLVHSITSLEPLRQCAATISELWTKVNQAHDPPVPNEKRALASKVEDVARATSTGLKTLATQKQTTDAATIENNAKVSALSADVAALRVELAAERDARAADVRAERDARVAAVGVERDAREADVAKHRSRDFRVVLRAVADDFDRRVLVAALGVDRARELGESGDRVRSLATLRYQARMPKSPVNEDWNKVTKLLVDMGMATREQWTRVIDAGVMLRRIARSDAHPPVALFGMHALTTIGASVDLTSGVRAADVPRARDGTIALVATYGAIRARGSVSITYADEANSDIPPTNEATMRIVLDTWLHDLGMRGADAPHGVPQGSRHGGGAPQRRGAARGRGAPDGGTARGRGVPTSGHDVA